MKTKVSNLLKIQQITFSNVLQVHGLFDVSYLPDDVVDIDEHSAHLSSFADVVASLVNSIDLYVKNYLLYEMTFFNCSWYEWLLLIWLSGNLLAELATPRDRGGLGWLRMAVLFISAAAILIHAVSFLLPSRHWTVALFFRNQLLAVAVLLCCMLLLDFLSFHYLFGPWAIIIGWCYKIENV